MNNDILDSIRTTADKSASDIAFHRSFRAAEEDSLMVRPAPIRTTVLLGEVCGTFLHREEMVGRFLSVAPSAEDRVFSSDKIILVHALAALVANALEATAVNGRVTISCTSVRHGVQFSVHNEGGIPVAEQGRIYERSFSTKADDRGFGTYACKLFVEKFLTGTTWFESTPEEGTQFFISLPERIVVQP
jgi:signal transduction histidine kinase